jgi:hypothetical protein
MTRRQKHEYNRTMRGWVEGPMEPADVKLVKIKKLLYFDTKKIGYPGPTYGFTNPLR